MKAYFKEHLTSIFNKLEIPLHFNSDSEIFSIVISKDNHADSIASWYRDDINVIIFFCVIQTQLTPEDCEKISLPLMILNETLVFGNIGITKSVNEGKWIVVYQHSLLYERADGFLVTEEEIKEFLSYASYILPNIHEQVEKLLVSQSHV
jgi:hypothetical protein